MTARSSIRNRKTATAQPENGTGSIIGAGWTGSTWPGSPGDADETTWAYDEGTGLLTRKTYADTKHVDYTCTDDGKLETRTHGRRPKERPDS
ncbi:MAG: hypothetical protein HY718_12395 [Planctomycetes bacterium]|nr:hypothetical protein [Planctomycetota bacterium]